MYGNRSLLNIYYVPSGIQCGTGVGQVVADCVTNYLRALKAGFLFSVGKSGVPSVGKTKQIPRVSAANAGSPCFFSEAFSFLVKITHINPIKIGLYLQSGLTLIFAFQNPYTTGVSHE